MHTTNLNLQKYTMDDIVRLKQELSADIQNQKRIMSDLTHEIFDPVTPAPTGKNGLMHSLNTGMAVIDGVVLGVKVIRKFRSFFHHKKKKRHSFWG